MRILSAEETAALLPYPALAESIARVLADHARGQITAPERLVVPLAGSATLLLMPAADPSITVTKLVTVHPQQHPSVRAEVWVMRTKTGERLALLEGSVVTARRTAAVSLLAAQTLAPNPTPHHWSGHPGQKPPGSIPGGPGNRQGVCLFAQLRTR